MVKEHSNAISDKGLGPRSEALPDRAEGTAVGLSIIGSCALARIAGPHGSSTDPRSRRTRPTAPPRATRHVPCGPLALAGMESGRSRRTGAGRRDVAGPGTGHGHAQPARHQQPDRLPAAPAPARVRGRRPVARRIRRGAAHLHAHRSDPQGDEGRRARHRGRQLLSPRWRGFQGRAARRAGAVLRGQEPGRLHHHDAVGAQLLPQHRKDLHPQDLRDPAGLQDRGPDEQGPDPGGLHEPDLPRTSGLRFCRRQRGLLRQALEGADGGRSRHAGGAAQGAFGLQPLEQPPACRHPTALHHRAHARQRLHQRRPA